MGRSSRRPDDDDGISENGSKQRRRKSVKTKEDSDEIEDSTMENFKIEKSNPQLPVTSCQTSNSCQSNSTLSKLNESSIKLVKSSERVLSQRVSRHKTKVERPPVQRIATIHQSGKDDVAVEMPFELLWPRTFQPKAAICRFFSRRSGAVESVAFTPDGLWLAVGRGDGQIDVYDVTSELIQFSLPGGESQSVRTLMFIEKLKKPKSSEELPSIFNYRLISTGLHGVITEWNLLTQTAIREIPSFGGAVFAADVSHSLGLLATASDDGSARLFKLRSNAMSTQKVKAQKIVTNDSDADDSSTEEEEEEEILTYWKSMTRHSGRLLSVCFYGDGLIFGGTADSAVLRWNLSSGTTESKMTVHRFMTRPEKRGGCAAPVRETQIWSIVSLPQFGIIATSDSSGNVTIWDVVTSTAVKVFHPHESDVLSMCTSPSSFFSVGVDGRLSIFTTTPNGEWIHNGSRNPHDSDIRAVSVSSLGRVATGSVDTYVKLTANVQSLKPSTIRLPNTSAVISSSWVLYCHSLRLVVTVLPSRIDIWCLVGEDVPVATAQLEDRDMTPLPSAPEVKPVKVASIDLDDNGPWAGIRSAALSSDGSLIAVSNKSGTRLFKLDLDELTIQTVEFKRLKQHVCSALHFASIGNGGAESLVAGVVSRTKGGKDDQVRLTVWDLENLTVVAEFKDVDSAIQTIRVSSDGQWIAVRTSAGRVSLYSLDTMQLVVRLPLFPKLELQVDAPASLYMAAAMSFSPNSKYLCVFRSTPGVFMLYNMTTRSIVTADEFKPKYNAHEESGIFKMVSVCQKGEIGDVQWLSAPIDDLKDSGIKSDSLLYDFVIDRTLPVETLLYKTLSGIGATRFQLIRKCKPSEDEADDIYENGINNVNEVQNEIRNKKRSRDEMSSETPHQSDSIPILKIPPKVNPCKATFQTWGGDVLRVVANAEDGKKPSLIVFSQVRSVPLEELPAMFQRKRFAAT